MLLLPTDNTNTSKMSPKISVLIPLYNVENFVGRCLDSILNQSFQDFEIIIVDDASTDNSLQIVKTYQQKDKRIKIIHKNINEGSMLARETGYKNATGEYYLFCDSDDYLPPNSLEILYSNITPNDDIIIGDVLVEYQSGGSKLIKRSNIINGPKQYKKAILTGTTCALWGILFNARLFKNYNYISFYRQNFYEDRILLVQILENIKSIRSISEIIYVYYLNKGSITLQRHSNHTLKCHFKAMKWCYDWNKKEPGLNDLNNRWLLRTLSSYLVEGYQIFPIIKQVQLSEQYNFKNICRYCGLFFSLNVYICKYFKYYHRILFFVRSLKNKTLRKV